MHERITDLEVVSDTLEGSGGFLAVRRLRLRNIRGDGSRSAVYVCDFLVRPKGADAVVVAVFCREPESGRIKVLLRDGLRPALHFGRAPGELAVPDRRGYLFFREIVAGIVEPEDRGETGLRRRAAAEVEEEAGLVVDPKAVILLGAGTFPSPGAMPERFFLAAVEISDPTAAQPPEGDGSPMEEGAAIVWLELEEAIAACVAGEIEDLKTELTLRRLRDWLSGGRHHRAISVKGEPVPDETIYLSV